MDCNNRPTPDELKYLIMNAMEPLLLKNILTWNLVKWDLSDWERILNVENLQFRCGKNSFTQEPQWERTTSVVNTSFRNFLSSTQSDSSKWMYFDYKYLKEHLTNIKELMDNIAWKDFGFPDLSSEDSTIWVGSKGAHTPCHMDTYGCNLIAQIHGRKQWIVFPPEENLIPTRIPYEESSVYSKLNFFSPSLNHFKGISNCRRIILNPGDVLFLPHKWWHYVENLDTAISINVWLPSHKDNEERLTESIVQFFMAQLSTNVTDEVKNVVINPNSLQEMNDTTFSKSFNLINTCKTLCKNSGEHKKSVKNKNIKTNTIDVNTILTKYPFIEKIPKLLPKEFNSFLLGQSNRFEQCSENTENCENDELFCLINAITHPDVIFSIKNKLLQ